MDERTRTLPDFSQVRSPTVNTDFERVINHRNVLLLDEKRRGREHLRGKNGNGRGKRTR